ncbi:MAG: glycosyltransferase family 4 protein [Calditrichaeota bacterium]|nr:glycosyltransferase family 4 protein [Calditrichota bacterium]
MSSPIIRQPKRDSLRVLMTNWIYSPEYGGGARQCQLLVRHLKQKGVEVEVVARTRQKRLLGQTIVDGVRVTRVPDANGQLASRMRTAAALVAELTRRYRWADVVHMHGFMPEVTLAARMAGQKVVQKVTLVGLDDASSLQKRKSGAVAAWIARMADAVVGPSQAAIVSSLVGGIPAHRLWSIPNGVDLGRFRPATELEKRTLRQSLGLDRKAFLVVFVGGLERRKGLDVAIRAIALARSKGLRPVQLLVLGVSPESLANCPFGKELSEIVARHQLDSVVNFLGVKENVEEYLRCADVFVLPSRAEGQPNALLEAMACRLACVARTLPGVTDELLLPGRRGYLVDDDEAAGFAGALVELAEAKELRAAFGAQARAYVERHHDIRHVAEAYRTLYRMLVES